MFSINKNSIVIMIMAGLLLSISSSFAESFILSPSDDMYTDEENAVGHAIAELWTADWSPVNNFQRINMRFDLSEIQGKDIESATLNLYRFFGCPSGEPTTTSIYHITSAWSETDWPENVNSPHGNEIWANYVFSANGWHNIDLTNLVKSWNNGDLENFGFVIKATNSKFTKIYSKESANEAQHPFLEIQTVETGIMDQTKNNTVNDFQLDAYPNPFNASTSIKFQLNSTEKVSISIYNLFGEKVDDVCSAILQAGNHEFNYNADNRPSGLYFIKLNSGSKNQIKRIILLK